MNEQDYDIQGRRVAQFMWDELEKIAYSRAAARMLAEAAESQKVVKSLAETLGWKRLIPFSKTRQAYVAAKTTARQQATAAEARAAKDKAYLLKAMKKWQGDPEKLRRIQETLARGPQNIGAIQRRMNIVRRKMGVGPDVQQVKPKKKEMSFAAKAGIAGASGLALGAGGLFAGQQYLQSREQDPYAYGG